MSAKSHPSPATLEEATAEYVEAYAEYLTTVFPIHRAISIEKKHIAIVLRGLPGCGKSSLVDFIRSHVDECRLEICSADDYFIDNEGVYRYDRDRIVR